MVVYSFKRPEGALKSVQSASLFMAMLGCEVTADGVVVASEAVGLTPRNVGYGAMAVVDLSTSQAHFIAAPTRITVKTIAPSLRTQLLNQVAAFPDLSRRKTVTNWLNSLVDEGPEQAADAGQEA